MADVSLGLAHEVEVMLRKVGATRENFWIPISQDENLARQIFELVNAKSVILEKITSTPLIIGATTGKRIIADAKNVFPSGIYGFNKSKPAQSTSETLADIYKLVKNGTYLQMLSSVLPTIIGADGSLDKAVVRKLCKTQDQIIEFCDKHRGQLSRTGATFFLFEEDGEFFVAGVSVDSDGLDVYRSRLGYSDGWDAEYDHRFVLPQLAVA